MRLSELFELSPLAYELAKKETIRQHGKEYWESRAKDDYTINGCFMFINSDNEDMWFQIEFTGKTTLLKQWETEQIANQTK